MTRATFFTLAYLNNMEQRIKHILLVDDRDDHNFLNEIIIKDSGLYETVNAVTSAHEALDYLKNTDTNTPPPFPDLIFLDINMPLMDGWEFLEELESMKGQLKRLPDIYMLSTSSYYKDIEKSKRYKLVSGFITKPLDEDILKNLQNGLPIEPPDSY